MEKIYHIVRYKINFKANPCKFLIITVIMGILSKIQLIYFKFNNCKLHNKYNTFFFMSAYFFILMKPLLYREKKKYTHFKRFNTKEKNQQITRLKKVRN